MAEFFGQGILLLEPRKRSTKLSLDAGSVIIKLTLQPPNVGIFSKGFHSNESESFVCRSSQLDLFTLHPSFPMFVLTCLCAMVLRSFIQWANCSNQIVYRILEKNILDYIKDNEYESLQSPVYIAGAAVFCTN